MFNLSENTSISSFISGCDSLITIDFPIFDLEKYQFTQKLGNIEGGINFKYINLKGFAGDSSSFATLFNQLHNKYNLNSLVVCVNDSEIINSARYILFDENINMKLEYCCDSNLE